VPWGTKKNVTVALRVGQIERLREEARRQNQSQAKLIRRALDLYFKTRNEGSFIDEALKHLRLATVCVMESGGRDDDHDVASGDGDM
tara:strand:+ start:475 stop:735 length:261 start_codon:yes stop_codon:yes gene_type:complete